MEEVRQLVQEEGREARNLVAFHVAVDSPGRVARKPPRATALLPRRAPPRPTSRLRSASTGRDKRSELRARYWALLFGDLQRAVGEIYNTVEANENQNECQEVILVLENYTRDFKALGEWFRLKWDYDNTPPPQRPQSLAWEIRKTDFVGPETKRTHSVKSSPSASGKNSPCLSGYNTPSGKNSPNLTGKASPSGKVSPRILGHSSNTSPKANVEFFSSKISSVKNAAKPEPKTSKEVSRLSDIKEKDAKECQEENLPLELFKLQDDAEVKIDLQMRLVEKGKAKEYPNVSPKQVVIKSKKMVQMSKDTSPKTSVDSEEICNHVKVITDKLNLMENDFLHKQLTENSARNDNLMNADSEKQCDDKEIVPENLKESSCRSEDNFADISNKSLNKSKSTECVKGILTGENELLDMTEDVDKKVHEQRPICKNTEKTCKNKNQSETIDGTQLKEIDKKQEIVFKDTQNPVTTDIQPESDTNQRKGFDDVSKVSDTKEIRHSAIETTECKLKENDTKNFDQNCQNDTKNFDQKCDSEVKIKIHESKNDKSETKKSEADLESKKLELKILEHEAKKFDTKIEQELKKNEMKVALKPAYSQAAAKPKVTSSSKTDVKTATSRSTTPLTRSRTVVEMKSNTTVKSQKQFPRRNQPSKCSYPFNLTTGRTTLFDTTPLANLNKGTLSKKTFNKNLGMGSGDAKSVLKKNDINKKPPPPTTLKINGKGDKKDAANPVLEKIKDCEEYSSTDTIVTQIDISRIESNESLKTLVPEEIQMSYDVTNSLEVLNVNGNKNDDDGWLTVKSRRLSRESKKQSKSHWANRFHQPSATTSLPTLNMIESPKPQTKPIINTSAYVEVERAKSEQPKLVQADTSVNVGTEWARYDQPKHIHHNVTTKVDPEQAKSKQLQHVLTEKLSKNCKVTTKPKLESKVKNGAIIRQKSDVTGLKSRSARNKALTKRTEKAKDSRKQDETSELIKNRLHSSLESLTMGLARSQESTEEVFDFDKWKAEFKTTFKYLDDDDQVPNDTEILKTADPSEMSEIAEMTSQIEENERRLGWALDFQSEVDQRKLCEEEDLLNRQIMELQQVSDIDLDTETDDTETDAEIVCEDNPAVAPSCASLENLGSLAASLEDQYETALAGMSWAERVDTLVVLEALVARDPGRAQQLHAKLSQGIKRRGSLQDALRRLQAKQARAERQRLKYQTERAKKIHQLLARVEEVKVAKNQLIEEKRIRMERRLQRAAENRDQYLKDIVRKAHDEEEKLKEIAFIKQLEAENRRHDFLDQCRSHTTRLRQMRRDRLRKLEQKAAREAAVGARRQALEEARRLHVETLLEKKKERDARVDQLNQLKKQERDDAAREKAEGVKSRLSALAAAAELEADALRSRIRDKQDASQQRLESHLQAIREKATGPRQATTSESQDQCTKELEEEVDRFEQEKKEKDKQKAIKKKARKVRQKLLSAGHSGMFDESAIATESFLNPVSSRMSKTISQINYIIAPLAQLLSKEISGKCCNNPNCDDYDTEKNNMKNTNNIVNGTEHVENGGSKKKTKKKKNIDDNSDIMKENEQNDKIEFNKIKNDKKDLEKHNPKETQVSKIDTNSHELVSTDTIKNENGKKKKKNKNKEQIEINNEKNRSNDKPKLSKASSICSSISDTSKTSNKVDKKMKIVVDVPQLERQLNELFRLVEKFGKSAADKTTYQKLQGLKCLGQFLAIVAERDDLAAQFTAKCVTTAVSIISVWVGGCCGSAAYLLSTNTCVHLVKLLSDQMEKDLQLDHKEMELAKQLSDCLSIALDSVLCSTRLYEEGKEKEKMEKPGEDLELLTALRGRAHTLISYLCLSGCVSRAERAGEARESIQTLLTVCADLCHPCDIDVGTERTSAQQSLRCALGTSLCGSRAEFCILFVKGAGLEECGGFVRAARTAHLLRALAEMDHQIVQEAFGEGGWPLEFRAAVARLLSQHAPSEKEAPRSTTFTGCDQRLDQSLSETMVLDLIVLVGFVIVNNPQLQETICDGWSVIKTLCTLPANWLVSRTHSHALLPTLTALAERQESPERATIAAELSLQMLEDYLECPEAQKVKLVQVIKQARSKRSSGKK